MGLAAVVALAGTGRPAAGAPRAVGVPHILIISVDTLRADHLGIYGYPRPTDPDLARLTRDFTVYRRATTPIPLTVPAHAALLTGRFPRDLGLLNNRQRLSATAGPVLAELLGAAGYRTAAVVASSVLASATGLDRGFHVYDEPPAHGPTRRGASEINARVSALLETGRPLFLLVHYYDPHDPYQAPDRYSCLLRPDAALAGILRARRLGRVNYHQVLNHVQKAPVLEEGRPLELPEMLARYDASVRLATSRAANLVELWDAVGMGDDSLVIITSDHGEGLGQHGFWSHGMNLHEEALRIPLLVRWPAGMGPAVDPGEPVSLLDLMPTVLQAADLPVPAGLPGISLAAGGPRPSPLVAQRMRYLYQDRPPGVRHWRAGDGFALTQGAFKYITEFEGEPALYDHSRDPGEEVNLAGRGHPEEDRLRRRLDRWLAAHPDAASWPPQPPDPERLRVLRSLGYADH